MLYIQKLMDLVLVLCGVAILALLLYMKATSQEIVFVEEEKRHEVSNELADYKRDWRDCLTLNRSISDDTMMEEEMTACLEERGHH